MDKKTKCNEQQIIRQDKLARIGQLSAGIAHEVNNPLGFISSNIETARLYLNEYKEMLDKYKEFVDNIEDTYKEDVGAKIRELRSVERRKNIEFISNDLEDMFDDIEDGLERITNIVSSLKAFSRQGTNEFTEYNLNQSINNTLIITDNDIKYVASVKKNLNEIPNIQADGNKIDQALLNIILNASFSIKEKQKILNKNQENYREDGLITITTSYNSAYISCTIEDNGIGISDENISRIFDPFYTSKAVSGGTGLGLSIAHDIIVTQHGGALNVESKPMKGAKFTILLPVDQKNVSGEDIDE